MLAAGLDGVKNKIEPPAPVSGNVYRMSKRERSRLKIKSLPADLGEALDALEKDDVLKDALGEHAFSQFITAKRAEWQDGRFIHPHDACFDKAGNIYTVEWVVGGRVTKLTKV
jgi:glutamine synthetase